MAKSTPLTSKNFATKLASTIKSVKNARENLQAFLVFGLAHYEKEADTCYLDKCVKACIGVGALDTRKMREYLQAHANIAWTKIEIKSGVNAGKADHVFKKKGEHAEVTLPDTAWYEFEKEQVEKPPVDVLVKLVNFRKTIAKEIEDKHVTDMKMAKRVLEGIDFEIASLTAPAGTKLQAVA